MTKEEWNNSYTDEMHQRFVTALFFVNSKLRSKGLKNRNCFLNKITKKYINYHTVDFNIPTPTKGEYDRLLANRHVKRYFERVSKLFKVGDIVYIPKHYSYLINPADSVGIVIGVHRMAANYNYTIEYISTGERVIHSWDTVLPIHGRKVMKDSK